MKFITLFILACFSFTAVAQEAPPTAPAKVTPAAQVSKQKPAVVPKPVVKKSAPLEPEREYAVSKPGFDVHAQLGVPYVQAIGVDYFAPNRSWSLGVMAGGYSGTASDYKFSLSQVAVVGRWFPWQSSFYMGLIGGMQKTSVTATEVVNGVTGEATIAVSNMFLTPNLGWMWVSKLGISWGFELGAQMNTSASSTVTTNTTDPTVLNDVNYQKSVADAKDAGDKFGHSVFPHITLLRIGYVF